MIVSYGKYPNGNAGAVRQHTFAKLFMDCGYRVTVIGMGDSTDFKLRNYEGVDYVSFRKDPNTVSNRALNWLLYGRRLKHFLKEHPSEFTDILFIKSYFASVANYIKRYARKHGIKLYHDSVEWYSPEEFSMGKLALGYRKNNHMNTHTVDKQFHVIAISKYLHEFFESRGIDTIRIPVIMDSESTKCEKKTDHDKLIITYAGRIGKKDYIANIINGFLLLSPEEQSKIELRLIGAKSAQVAEITGISEAVLREHAASVKCMGRVPREVVLDNLSETDFTILIRDASLRYAKAGFPTKVVESLMCSTPVICNLSSDLGDYLTDGYNAVIAEDMSEQKVCQAIRRALELSREKRVEMQQNARKTAVEVFDYRNYLDEFGQWSNK